MKVLVVKSKVMSLEVERSIERKLEIGNSTEIVLG